MESLNVTEAPSKSFEESKIDELSYYGKTSEASSDINRPLTSTAPGFRCNSMVRRKNLNSIKLIEMQLSPSNRRKSDRRNLNISYNIPRSPCKYTKKPDQLLPPCITIFSPSKTPSKYTTGNISPARKSFDSSSPTKTSHLPRYKRHRPSKSVVNIR